MTDALGWRRKFGVIAPSTNTIVEPDFHRMGVPGVTSHFSRIHIRDQNMAGDAGMERLLEQIRDEIGAACERVLTCEPDYMVMGMSAETFWGGYSGVFVDPDGHPWEVAHNPFWTVTDDGRTLLSGDA